MSGKVLDGWEDESIEKVEPVSRRDDMLLEGFDTLPVVSPAVTILCFFAGRDCEDLIVGICDWLLARMPE